MVFAALIGGLVGSRIDYLVQNWDRVSDDLLGNLFSGSGLVLFGGLVGGAIGVIIWARWRGVLELGAGRHWRRGPMAIGYAVGRVGCQLSGDGDYGTRIRPALGDGLSRRHRARPPTRCTPRRCSRRFAMGIAALVLWHLRDRFAPGVLFGLYLVIVGVERFLIEIIRRNDSVVAGLTLPQLISVAVAALGAAIIVTRRRAPRRPARERGAERRPPSRRGERTARAPPRRPAAMPRWCEA